MHISCFIYHMVRLAIERQNNIAKKLTLTLGDKMNRFFNKYGENFKKS